MDLERWWRTGRLVDRDCELESKSIPLSISSMLEIDKHPAAQSCQPHEGYLNGGMLLAGYYLRLCESSDSWYSLVLTGN